MMMIIKNFLDRNLLFCLGLIFLPFYFLAVLAYNFARSGEGRLDLVIVISIFIIYSVYFLSWQKLKNYSWRKEDLKIILFFSALFILIFFFAVPIVHTDFYHYFFEDVSLVFHNQNPFFTAPLDLPTEPLSYLSGWDFLPMQHGPFRLFITVPAVMISGGDIVIGLFLYKLIFAGFLIGSYLIFYKILTCLKVKNWQFAMLLFTWNPLIIYETFINGGTDVLLVFWILLSIYFLVQKKFSWAIVALTISVLIKYITVILIPFFLLYFLAQHQELRKKVFHLIKYLVLIGTIIIVCFLPFWRGIETLYGTIWVAKYFGANSIAGFFSLLFYFIDSQLNIYSFKIIFEILFFIVYLFLLLKFFRIKQPKPLDLIYYSFLVLSLFLLIGKFWFYPKYLIWVIPLILLLDKKYYPIAIFLTGLVIFSYFDPPLIIFLIIPPVLIFSFYYFIKDLHSNIIKL